jgi:hypothetical protein
MAVNFEHFFGFAASGTSDGFPGNPAGSSGESTGHSRFYPVTGGSGESIRLPSDVNNASTSLGYRRNDADGALVWLISWATIATFTGDNATLLASGGHWHSSCANNSNIYIGFYDLNGELDVGANPFSYIVQAPIATGIIASVTRVNLSASTILTTTIGDKVMFGSDDDACFWEITDNDKLRMGIARPNNVSGTSKGIAFVEMSSNYSTIDTETAHFNYTSAFGLNVPAGKNVAYFTKDLTIFVTGEPDDVRLVVPGHSPISLDGGVSGSFAMELGYFLSSMVSNTYSDSVSQNNHINDDTVEIQRRITSVTTETNGAQSIPRCQITRANLDNALKNIVFNYLGVNL